MTSISISTRSQARPSPDDVALKTHHNKDKKGFSNPWPSFQETNFWTIMRWVWLGKLEGKRKDPDLTGSLVPVRRPLFLPTRSNPDGKLRATWLGHACFYLEFPNGLRILFDPVFEERCSPFSFAGPKRYTEAPCQVEDLPFVDVLVVSHNHYDHMSWPTLRKLKDQFPDVQVFTPLGNRKWFVEGGFKNVEEMDWWEEREVKVDADREEMEVSIGCLPAQHTSARFGWDKGERLWGSFSLEAGGKRVWFAGDTGYRTVPRLIKEEDDYGEAHKDLPYCPAFKQIGELRGPFDLGLIPIGAYEPRWLMSPVHANPYDAVNIFADTKCERALGIHWGTWVLTEEEVLEPPRLLKEAMKKKGMQEEGQFDVCDIGDSRTY
ncbi:hypothetical protein DOTSEDRAFT_176872 [Dothistroma septosporum NZE10]|uniref:Metallo-beta-lactamase domain-containing protein n=1 Tax=Dothistroma septosporum (strain NZE10 / CBS 128990) TaxID=675120 RepID=N1PJZ1_DOTSN|nr:hypothetical protein DOTSEDRAFT_176872 [Dothistroma septosporum NZE10]